MILKTTATIVALVLGCMFLQRKKGKIYFNEWSVLAWIMIGCLVIGAWTR